MRDRRKEVCHGLKSWSKIGTIDHLSYPFNKKNAENFHKIILRIPPYSLKKFGRYGKLQDGRGKRMVSVFRGIREAILLIYSNHNDTEGF